MSQVWRLGDRRINCDRPQVMLILNATPDSFYAGSRVVESGSTLKDWLEAILADKPDIIDIGGQSTRPGSERVGSDEELRRVIPVIDELRRLDNRIPITIDTYHAAVAKEALNAGADGVNDISAGSIDPEIIDVVAETACGYVLMHMQGTPETMQRRPHYRDCTAEVADFLRSGVQMLEAKGIDSEHVVLDPGIGFGKRLEDNLALIRDATELKRIGRPLLYGISRKSFIGKLAEEPDAGNRLPGTLALTWELLDQGVMLHRVHDAAETRQLFAVWKGIRKDDRIVGN